MTGLTEGERRYLKRLEARRRKAVRDLRLVDRLRLERTINNVHTAAGEQAPYGEES